MSRLARTFQKSVETNARQTAFFDQYKLWKSIHKRYSQHTQRLYSPRSFQKVLTAVGVKIIIFWKSIDPPRLSSPVYPAD